MANSCIVLLEKMNTMINDIYQFFPRSYTAKLSRQQRGNSHKMPWHAFFSMLNLMCIAWLIVTAVLIFWFAGIINHLKRGKSLAEEKQYIIWISEHRHISDCTLKGDFLREKMCYSSSCLHFLSYTIKKKLQIKLEKRLKKVKKLNHFMM